jgi:hypothetical protein
MVSKYFFVLVCFSSILFLSGCVFCCKKSCGNKKTIILETVSVEKKAGEDDKRKGAQVSEIIIEEIDQEDDK